MELQERVEGNTLIVKVLYPRLDSGSSRLLKQRIGALIRGGHQQLVLDLSNVDSIDFSGLNALVFALKQLGNYGDFAISGPRNSVVSIFKLTRLYKVFNIFPDCDQAIAALRG